MTPVFNILITLLITLQINKILGVISLNIPFYYKYDTFNLMFTYTKWIKNTVKLTF